MVNETRPSVDEQAIVAVVRDHFPNVEAIYLFGSLADGSQTPQSDLDIALLLPPDEFKALASNLLLHPLHGHLCALAGREVDLLNLRRLNTVLQKEVVMNGRRIDCADRQMADEFEIGVISRYCKLNEERAEILAQFARTNRAYDL